MILNCIGIGLFLLGAGWSYWQYNQIVGKDVTVGRVTTLEPKRGNKGGTVYTVVADFHDRGGHLNTYRAGFSSSSPGYRVGDPIRIYFDRNNPADCGVLSFGFRFGAGWILIVAGLACCAVHYGWVFGDKWLLEHFPNTVHSQPMAERPR